MYDDVPGGDSEHQAIRTLFLEFCYPSLSVPVGLQQPVVWVTPYTETATATLTAWVQCLLTGQTILPSQSLVAPTELLCGSHNELWWPEWVRREVWNIVH